MSNEAIILICAPLGFFLLLFGFILLMRYLSFRETVALADKGLIKSQMRANDKGALRWGIAIAALGLALCLGLWPLGFVFGDFPLGFGPWMLLGLLPTFFGLSLVLSHYLTTREDKAGGEPKDADPVA